MANIYLGDIISAGELALKVYELGWSEQLRVGK
jgi:hypothetical protein